MGRFHLSGISFTTFAKSQPILYELLTWDYHKTLTWRDVCNIPDDSALIEGNPWNIRPAEGTKGVVI